VIERIKIVKGGLTDREFSRRAGLTLSTFQYILQSGNPKTEQLVAIARAGGVSVDWLATGEGPGRGLSEPPAAEWQPVAEADRVLDSQIVAGAPGRMLARRAEISVDGESWGYVMVPRFDVAASAGAGSLVERENVLDYMAFREDWVRRVLRVEPGNLVLITSVGDSMEETIRNGDLLLVDVGVDRIVDDAIYVLVKGGELVVKRVQQFFSGAVVIKSDNAAYDDETVAGEQLDQLKVAGRVRWIGRII